jgi:chromosome partitioning protein
VRRVAVVNQKGGSGKTTTAVCLAGALGETGRRVALLDLDPQASATSWYGVSDSDPGLAELFAEDRPLRELVRPTDTPGVVVGPGSAWLLGLDKALADESDAEECLSHAMTPVPPEPRTSALWPRRSSARRGGQGHDQA